MSQNIIDDDRRFAEAEEPPQRVRAFFMALWLLGCVGIGLAAIQFTRERTTSLQIGDCAAVHEDASRLRCLRHGRAAPAAGPRPRLTAALSHCPSTPR